MKSGKWVLLAFFGVILLTTLILTLLFGNNFRQYSGGAHHSASLSTVTHDSVAADSLHSLCQRP